MKALVCLFLLISLSAGAATVRLKDGGTVEGTVEKADPTEVIVRTPAGPRRIPGAFVSGIDYEKVAASPSPESKPAFDPVKDSFSAGIGLAVPLSGINFNAIGGGRARAGDTGGAVSLRWLHDLNPSVAAGLDFDYMHRSMTNSPGLLPLADAGVSGDDLLLLGVTRLYLRKERGARPYLLGGVGVARTWTQVDAQPRPGYAWTDTNTDETRRLIDDGAWGFAATARVGVDFDWESSFVPAVFGLEAGWTGIQSRRFAATQAGKDLGLTGIEHRLDVFSILAHWSWRW